ncbi:CpaF family protein [candidate division KSB1 bacterium]|nr:CpaF family protein [candidate division KSB1 bacterium]
MGLLKRLQAEEPNTEVADPIVESAKSKPFKTENVIVSRSVDEARHAYHTLKEKIHRRLIDKLDLTKLDSIPKHVLKAQVREVIEILLSEENITPIHFDRDRLTEEVLDETFGLGPLEPLLNDPTISDILVNTHKQVFVERFGKLSLTHTVFKDDTHLLNIIDRIVSRIGRRIDEFSPMVDARLEDGSRVNAIIPPLAIDGPSLSIRKFGVNKISIADLVRLDTITDPIAQVIQAAVKARLNVLVSGGTGSGKTTLLNILSGFIPDTERIVTVEDAAELQLQQEHVVRLETRPANLEGKGIIVQRDLIRNALRMRPDRIIVGEVRGAEALDMLQAMNTGHDGSLTTLHANSPRDALRRLETMILMAGNNLSDKAMREQISSAIHLIVQVARLSDGSRKIMQVSEVTGMEGSIITMQDIFKFEKMGVREDGVVLGGFRTTGLRPRFAEQLVASGITLPADIFEPKVTMPAQPDEESEK